MTGPPASNPALLHQRTYFANSQTTRNREVEGGDPRSTNSALAQGTSREAGAPGESTRPVTR